MADLTLDPLTEQEVADDTTNADGTKLIAVAPVDLGSNLANQRNITSGTGTLTAKDERFKGLEDTALVIDIASLTANDSFTATGSNTGTVTQATFVGVTGAVGGTATFDTRRGVMVFRPEANYNTPTNGMASFGYTVRSADGTTLQATAQVSVDATQDDVTFTQEKVWREVTPNLGENKLIARKSIDTATPCPKHIKTRRKRMRMSAQHGRKCQPQVNGSAIRKSEVTK